MNYRFFAMLTLSASAFSAYAFPAGIVSPATSVQVGAQAKPIPLPGESSLNHDKNSQNQAVKKPSLEDQAPHLLSVAAVSSSPSLAAWILRLPIDDKGVRHLKSCDIIVDSSGALIISNSVELKQVILNSATDIKIGMEKDKAQVRMAGAIDTGIQYDREQGASIGTFESANLRFDTQGNLVEAAFKAQQTHIPRPDVEHPNPVDEGFSNDIKCQ